MKLPENYESWVEFAKACIEIQKKYPDSDTIKTGYDKNMLEFKIDAVKAKAFDEVMELALAARREVATSSTGIGTDMAVMTRFLILLTDGK